MLVRVLVVCTAGLWLAVAAGGAVPTRARAPAPPVTVATVRGDVLAIAQSSRYLAWRLCDTIQVRGVDGRRYAPVRLEKSITFPCYTVDNGLGHDALDHDVLAIVGRTVTWSEYGEGNAEEAAFRAALIGTGRRAEPVLPSAYGPCDSCRYVTGPSSDGSSLAYGWTSVAESPSCTEQQKLDSSCPLRATGGEVWMVDGALRKHRVAAAATTLVALAGGRVAYVLHAATGWTSGRGGPEPRVVVVSALDGRRVASVGVAGAPDELALSPRLAAVLIGSRGRIEWFDPRTGGSRGARAVPGSAAALSVAGRLIVYRVGSRILGFAPGDASPRVLAVARGGGILGPVAVGSRLLWLEVEGPPGRSVSRVVTLSLG